MSEAALKSLASSSSGSSLGSDVAVLIDELHAIVKTLPLQDPRSSEDIYGMDVSIMWGERGSGVVSWWGGGVRWREELKEKFKRAVDIAQELVDRAEKEGTRRDERGEDEDKLCVCMFSVVILIWFAISLKTLRCLSDALLVYETSVDLVLASRASFSIDIQK
ncbi:hypothetical protein MSAN_01097800 [Mycena sanguinolenta]|uniref:Uncharacterized protein n=1 Tax=Mycena sanguinolenta TaxID=230812 RepID=A0A8H6YQI6_9AGAR|nr:hypothetical protein MSAN_01097800 [Mycena sanguinolenta]